MNDIALQRASEVNVPDYVDASERDNMTQEWLRAEYWNIVATQLDNEGEESCDALSQIDIRKPKSCDTVKAPQATAARPQCSPRKSRKIEKKDPHPCTELYTLRELVDIGIAGGSPMRSLFLSWVFHTPYSPYSPLFSQIHRCA